MIAFIIATALSCCFFSFAYLYFLGLRIVRTGFNGKGEACFLGVIVGFGVLAATVTLEAVLLVGYSREVVGQLFYMASTIGVFVMMIGTVGLAGAKRPIEVALGHKTISRWGLALGNFIAMSINALSFARVLPSLL